MRKNLLIIILTVFVSTFVVSNSIEIPFGQNNAFDASIISFSVDKKKPDPALVDTGLKITHAVFAGITYAHLWALDGIGTALLYYAFTNPQDTAYQNLKWAHMGIAISALISFATVVTLAFTKLGFKIKNKYAIRKTHLTAAVVTLSFYVLELSTIIMSAVFFANNYDGAKWVGLAHGITCGATTLAFSVSFITVFF